MADLGAVGTLVERVLLYPVGRNAYSLSCAANPIGGILVPEQALRPFPYPEDLRWLIGSVIHPDPTAVTIIIRHWRTHHVTATTRADESGAWSAAVPPGQYDISYLADGRAPVAHGPYTVGLDN
jgi:hypothetical protein